jgi:hypothetical protein
MAKDADFRVRREVHWYLSHLDPKVDFSQTFPLMNDETVRPLVCVMSVAVFELWRTRKTIRGEKKRSRIGSVLGHWSVVPTIPHHIGFIKLDRAHPHAYKYK